LAEKLLESGDNVLGGNEAIGTVFFSDIRSFTTLSEELGVKRTVEMLNEYFSIMVECIQNEGGMLDKFIGDAIMAVFGAPISYDDDPDRGLRAAIQMMLELKNYNDKRVQEGLLPIDHGMGLNTGQIVSGNIGSEKRMDYTVIGDAVNLASRIEGSCKIYGAHILISDSTFKALKDTYRTRQIDKLIVKGKTVPVGIYEVLDYHNKESFPNMIEVLEMFNNGIEYYNEGNWSNAIKQFNKAQKGNPEDQCSSMYAERCEILKKEDPKDWDGVWVAESK
jgi:adenylate cyclase